MYMYVVMNQKHQPQNPEIFWQEVLERGNPLDDSELTKCITGEIPLREMTGLKTAIELMKPSIYKTQLIALFNKTHASKIAA